MKEKLPTPIQILLLLFWVVILPSSLNGKETGVDVIAHKKMYLKAINYIEGFFPDSTRRKSKDNCQNFYQNDVINDLNISISSMEIPNSINDCLCDYLVKVYKMKGGCARAYATQSKLLLEVSDSIYNSYKDNYFAGQNVRIILKDYVKSKEINEGYVIIFSNIYKNTLLAEVKIFCKPQEQNIGWQGKSYLFYFVFDCNNEIQNIFLGGRNYD